MIQNRYIVRNLKTGLYAKKPWGRKLDVLEGWTDDVQDAKVFRGQVKGFRGDDLVRYIRSGSIDGMELIPVFIRIGLEA